MGAFLGLEYEFAEVPGSIEMGQIYGAPSGIAVLSPISSSSSDDLESGMIQEPEIPPHFYWQRRMRGGRWVQK